MKDVKMENNPDIQKLQEDIQGIRRAIDLGSSVFKQIYGAANFRYLFLASSIGTAFLVILYAILSSLGISGERTGIWIISLSGGLVWLILFSYKVRITTREADKLGLKLNWMGLAKEQLSSRLWLAVIPTLLIMLLLPFKGQSSWPASEIGAYIGIVLGLVLNLIGVLISEREYLFCGFWMIITGALFFFILSWPVHLVLGLTLSPACLLFFIVSTFFRRD